MKRTSGWNQEVTDEQGRRRFHGAFTGGFSAGYYNSVGSKEGWQPSTFSSSRHERARAVQQRAEDFMDDDDDPLLGKRLETSAQFDPLRARALQKEQQQQLQLASTVTVPRNAFEARVLSAPQRATPATSASGLNLLDALVRPVNDSMGAKLLNRMGWKEGHGIGPRVRRKRIEDPGAAAAAANDDDEADVVYVPPRNTVDVASFPTPKLDVYGAGFDPYVNAPEFAQYKQRRAVAAKTEASQPARVTFADAMRAPAGRYDSVTGFGLSALEENDDLDVYGTAAMSEFDTELGGPKRLTNGNDVKRLDSRARESYGRAPAVGSDGRPALPGFEYAVKKDNVPKTVALRLHVPADFTAKHSFQDDETAHRGDAAALLYQQHNFSTEAHGRGAVMTAKQRAVLLSEPPAPPLQQEASNAASADSTKPSSSSVFDLLSPEQRTKLFAQAEALKSMRASGSAPASSDHELVAPPRAREPLVQSVAGSQFVANITASIAKRFVSASSTDEPTDRASCAAGAAPVAKKSHRSESVWIPNSLLCKRFRVKCVAGVTSQQQEQRSDAKRDLFDKELVPHLVEFAAERRSASARTTDASDAADCAPGASARGKQRPTRFGPRLSHATPQEQEQADNDASDAPPVATAAKPAPSLLKAIFEPSDESDEEEDDDDDARTSDDDDDDVKREGEAAQQVAAAATRESGTAAATAAASEQLERNETRRPNSALGATSARDCADASSSDESESDADDRARVSRATATTAPADALKRTEKRHKSSKKKKDKKKHKHKKHTRASRHSDSDDSDRAHRSKRSRRRSRSASRERSSSKRSSRRR